MCTRVKLCVEICTATPPAYRIHMASPCKQPTLTLHLTLHLDRAAAVRWNLQRVDSGCHLGDRVPDHRPQPLEVLRRRGRGGGPLGRPEAIRRIPGRGVPPHGPQSLFLQIRRCALSRRVKCSSTQTLYHQQTSTAVKDTLMNALTDQQMRTHRLEPSCQNELSRHQLRVISPRPAPHGRNGRGYWRGRGRPPLPLDVRQAQARVARGVLEPKDRNVRGRHTNGAGCNVVCARLIV